ncbi:MAG: hypothetical protein WDZ35_11535 [Crocinitomicaceae bacterium]
MDELDEVLEEAKEEKKIPAIVKTLAIISYVGNSFYALLMLAIIFLLESFKSEFVNQIEDADVSTDDFMLYMVVGCIILIIASIACIIGAYKMTKGKKWGFFVYTLFNALWVVALIMGGTPQGIVMGIVSIGFILGFASQLRHYNK